MLKISCECWEMIKVSHPDSMAHRRLPGSGYRGTLLRRNSPLLGPYSRTMPRVRWWSSGGGHF